MSELCFGSFEGILEAYITPKISQQDLAGILLLSPKIDVRDANKDTQRSAYGVERSTISKICSGEREVPKRIRKYYSEPDAFEYIKLCFATDIVPRIPNSTRGAFLQEIFALINQDEGLSANIKESFVQYSPKTNEDLGDFLAEVYMCAIRPRVAAPQVEKAPVVQETSATTGRLFYTLEEVEAGALDGIIAFNSISNSTIGHERNFVGAREYRGAGAGRKNVWNIGEITAKHDMEYIVRLYVHGSNKYGTDSVASNAKVAFNIPTETSKRLVITGFLFANNAHPNRYWDSIVFTSDIPFHFEYVYGSALIENNGIGKNGGKQLSDEIVTKAASNHGTLIGYNKLDGRIPSSYQYASYVTIRVKTVFDVPFLLSAKVRIAGAVDWGQSVKVKVGTTLEFYFKYKNNSDCKQNDVMMQCTLPPNLRYIPGSTKLYNTKYDGSVLSGSVTEQGVNLGNYFPHSDTLVRYVVEVVDDDLTDGENTLVTWVKCSVGELTRQESISIVVMK